MDDKNEKTNEKEPSDTPYSDKRYPLKWGTDGAKHHYTLWDGIKDFLFGDWTGRMLFFLLILGVIALAYLEIFVL